MLCHFFKPKTKVDDLKFDNPKSFYKYSYKNHEIILIGERHINMNVKLAEKYNNVFQTLFKKNPAIQLFVEGSEGSEGDEEKDAKNESLDGYSFIECINRVAFANKVKIIRSDQRNDKAFLGLVGFIFRLDSILEKIKIAQEEKKIGDWSPLMFDNPEFLSILKELTMDLNNGLNSKLFFEIIANAVEIVSELNEKYSVLYPELGNYIDECFDKLIATYRKLEELEKEYLSLGYEEKQVHNKSLIDICIEQIKNTKNFDPYYKLRRLVLLYSQYFYDATLVTDIWSTINKKSTKKIIIVVAGRDHTDRLSDLLNQVATPIVSLQVDKGEHISPKDMITYFNLEKPSEEKRASCSCLMM